MSVLLYSTHYPLGEVPFNSTATATLLYASHKWCLWPSVYDIPQYQKWRMTITTTIVTLPLMRHLCIHDNTNLLGMRSMLFLYVIRFEELRHWQLYETKQFVRWHTTFGCNSGYFADVLQRTWVALVMGGTHCRHTDDNPGRPWCPFACHFWWLRRRSVELDAKLYSRLFRGVTGSYFSVCAVEPILNFE